MSAKKFISVFTPSRTSPEDLEKIFVQRHDLLDDAVERVRDSALTPNKHHLLFVGPRGSGKTHLITLLVDRLGQQADLEKKLDIAWLNEDETSTTLLELLIRIYRALTKRYPEKYEAEALNEVFDLPPDAALERVKKTLLTTRGSRSLLIVVENLDALFDGLGDPGRKELRALIQEHSVFTIVATAQALNSSLTSREEPFYGFFQTEHLKPLDRHHAAKLLENIARLNEQADVVAFLQTARGRARVRALHHLSGGSHRIYIVLSHFISGDNIDDLVEPFRKMVDELTPYYQERIRWLPPQQRKIIESLCKSDGTLPVKVLAQQLFATHQTISNQLKDLRDKGYVKTSQRGRESLYEVTEPLMRICVEAKDNQSYEPLKLLIDFVRVWYNERELDDRLDRYQSDATNRSYLEAARAKTSTEGNLRQRLLVDSLREELSGTSSNRLVEELCGELQVQREELALAVESLNRGDPKEALELLTELTGSQDGARLVRGTLLSNLGKHEEAIADYTNAIELEGAPAEQVARALYNRGFAYGQRGEAEKEIADYTNAIELEGAPAEQVARALYNRGFTYGQRGEAEKAIADFTRSIVLNGASPRVLENLLAYIFLLASSPSGLAARVESLVAILEAHDARTFLGDALVRHLGWLHRSDSPPAQVQLEAWRTAWEQAADSVPELLIPMKLFRVGMRFLQSQDRNESILRDLRSDERELLRQALGIEAEQT